MSPTGAGGFNTARPEADPFLAGLLSTISERRGGLCAPIILVTMQNQRRRSCQRQDEAGRERGSGCISVLGCHHVHAFQNSASATEGETLPRFRAVELGNLLLPSQT